VRFLFAAAIALGSCTQIASPTPPPSSNVPCGASEVLIRHEHAHLAILIRGQIKSVPAFVGITANEICWLHTHDTSGIIHVEAGDNRAFTLGDFFALWRQPLSATTVDGETAGSGESIQVTINQQPYAAAPETVLLKDHEDIVLQLGPPFLTVAAYVWPPGY
jgi:hypothetical protein